MIFILDFAGKAQEYPWWCVAFCADALRDCFAVHDLQPLDALGLRETAAGSEVVKLDVLVCPGAAERVGSVPAPL